MLPDLAHLYRPKADESISCHKTKNKGLMLPYFAYGSNDKNTMTETNGHAGPTPLADATIQVRGARQNNLRNVDLDIPKRQLVVFTGISGSGKSSLVFDTIAAESQRLLNETYPAFLQSLMPGVPRPDVDSLHNLNAAIVVDQEPMCSNSRSTVGTATDAWALLRVLFARVGQPAVASPSALSFNDPSGMCVSCEGLGRVSTLDVDAILNRTLSLNKGAILFPNFAVGSLFWTIYAESGFFDPDKPIADYTDAELTQLLTGTGSKVKTGSYNLAYEGLLDKIQRLYLSKDIESLQPHVRRAVEEVATTKTCPACGGSRLNDAARACRIDSLSAADCLAMPITDLTDWVRQRDLPPVAPILKSLLTTLINVVEIGLGYLTLSRQTGTLSGGEAQRIKMVRHVDSSLTDLLYVFDEPTGGLHPHDVARMIELLKRLRDKGNTVLVVEHNRAVMLAADYIVDIGPGAGTEGGRVVYTGEVAGLIGASTPTGQCLNRPVVPVRQPRQPTGHLTLKSATLNNLQNVTVAIPLGVLTAVTGVAGSGKSSLVIGSMPRESGATLVDQSPIKGSRRSNPATYTGLFDGIREAFAKANKVKPALFSANSEGACPICNGLGVIYTDLVYMDAVASPCEGCGGKRFRSSVLAYTLRGLTIADVLNLSIGRAADFFTEPALLPMLRSLVEVGLGYVSLGQPLTTLSGGERQRLRLAIEIVDKAGLYVLDEPSKGLHMADVEQLTALLHGMVDRGNTVVVIEHNLDIIASADWVIDLGPGAGHHGGRVVYEGPPTQLPTAAESVTGRYLQAHRG